ncbi:hypothetical protein [Gimesia sp.]|uniref:hypothetical protein n=1 Tax=Gimesia sp. TaxID=2024833 RepID=UPI0032EB8933
MQRKKLDYRDTIDIKYRIHKFLIELFRPVNFAKVEISKINILSQSSKSVRYNYVCTFDEVEFASDDVDIDLIDLEQY